METIKLHRTEIHFSGKVLLVGKILDWICILFLLADGIMKVMQNKYHIEGSMSMGWSQESVQPIGLSLLFCTIVYLVPRTKLIGGLLLTGYLGGAVAVMARVGQPFYFPLVMAVLIWTAQCIQNEQLRGIILSRRIQAE
jgi:hypothetical protein